MPTITFPCLFCCKCDFGSIEYQSTNPSKKNGIERSSASRQEPPNASDANQESTNKDGHEVCYSNCSKSSGECSCTDDTSQKGQDNKPSHNQCDSTNPGEKLNSIRYDLFLYFVV